MKNAFTRLLKTTLFLVVWLSVILYLSQDIQVFPSAVPQLLNSSKPIKQPLPPGFERLEHTSTDGTKLELWKRKASKDIESRRKLRALILHGNGASLSGFTSMQEWMSSLGITNYSFDYRGTGGSQGWPSEAGIFQDSLSVYRRILEEENVGDQDLIIVGLSIGSGFAAGLAAEVGPKALVLFAPYISIPRLVKERPLLWLFTPLLRYNVPTHQFISRLGASCIIVGHGAQDNIIPIAHSDELSKLWNSRGVRWYKRFDNVDHNSLFFIAADEVADALADCLER